MIDVILKTALGQVLANPEIAAEWARKAVAWLKARKDAQEKLELENAELKRRLKAIRAAMAEETPPGPRVWERIREAADWPHA